jgi:hypothetical protein
MSNKASLMASLTGDLPEPEQDLFGEIPIDDEPVPLPFVTPQPMPAAMPAPVELPAGQLIVENPLDNPLSMSMPVYLTQTAPAPPKTKSLLASSGLLGDVGTGGGGGLFDEVDREEEERQRLEEQKQLEEERKRQAEEQIRLEQQRHEQERRRMAEEQMMQSVNLSASVAGYSLPTPQSMNQTNFTAANPPQQVHQVTNQMNQMSMSTPTTMSFSERSQMMQQQSAVSQYMQTPAPMYQQQQPRPDTFSPAGFYRPDPLPMTPQSGQTQPSTYVYSTTGGPVQTHTIAPTSHSMASAASSSRLPHTPTPSYTVGMHNSMGRQVRPLQIVQPPPFDPIYGHVTVSDPLLVQPPSLFNVVPPHWTYQVQTALKEGGCWLVRRRFRHIVALEDRLRDECPGAILPPRYEMMVLRVVMVVVVVVVAQFRLTHPLRLSFADLINMQLAPLKKRLPCSRQSLLFNDVLRSKFFSMLLCTIPLQASRRR